jgi:hypothetical protein
MRDICGGKQSRGNEHESGGLEFERRYSEFGVDMAGAGAVVSAWRSSGTEWGINSVGEEGVCVTSWYAVRWNLSFCLERRIFFITYLAAAPGGGREGSEESACKS